MFICIISNIYLWCYRCVADPFLLAWSLICTQLSTNYYNNYVTYLPQLSGKLSSHTTTPNPLPKHGRVILIQTQFSHCIHSLCRFLFIPSAANNIWFLSHRSACDCSVKQLLYWNRLLLESVCFTDRRHHTSFVAFKLLDTFPHPSVVFHQGVMIYWTVGADRPTAPCLI